MPQGSVLGPLLLTIYMYTYPLSTVSCESGLSYHFFADDSQPHNSSVPSDFPAFACCLKDYNEDVAEWMGDSRLKTDDYNTELTVFGTESRKGQVIPNLALCASLLLTYSSIFKFSVLSAIDFSELIPVLLTSNLERQLTREV